MISCSACLGEGLVLDHHWLCVSSSQNFLQKREKSHVEIGAQSSFQDAAPRIRVKCSTVVRWLQECPRFAAAGLILRQRGSGLSRGQISLRQLPMRPKYSSDLSGNESKLTATQQQCYNAIMHNDRKLGVNGDEKGNQKNTLHWYYSLTRIRTSRKIRGVAPRSPRRRKEKYPSCLVSRRLAASRCAERPTATQGF